MSDRPRWERWVLILDVRDEVAPVAVQMRRLIKHIGRRWGIRCRGFSEDKRLFELSEENKLLRQMIDGMAERIARQAELLARAAERKEPA